LNIRNGVENAVVGAVHDDRVLQLPGLLEVVDDPAHLGVRVLREAGVHLGHAREEALLVVGEARPRADGVALHDLALGQRVDRGQLRVLREDALLDHARQDPLAVGLVAVVEPALVLVDVLLRGVVRAGQNQRNHGLAGCDCFESRMKPIALSARSLERW
jgi:hypothetical protein